VKIKVLSLVVKGTKFDAAKAAAARRIPFAYRQEIGSPGDKETLGFVGTQYEKEVGTWFVDAPMSPPFPPGTLLSYSVTEKSGPLTFRNPDAL
jgi:hypothetical protein